MAKQSKDKEELQEQLSSQGSEPQKDGDQAGCSQSQSGASSKQSGGNRRRNGSRQSKQPKEFNDVNWYSKSQQLLQDASTFSFNTALGDKLKTQVVEQAVGTNSTPISVQSGGFRLPGVMQIGFIPTPGIADEYISPVNLAAQSQYTYIRHANSGRKNYDAPDLILYFMALDSVYMMINAAMRAYALARAYEQLNYYYPLGILRAAGFNTQDIQTNMNTLREEINTCIVWAGNFKVPANMPIFMRHSWMCSNVYMDSSDLKSQCYVFAPAIYYTYDETTSTKGGFLKAHQVPGNMKASTIIGIIRDMLNALQYAEDISTISGDVLKAYGENGLYSLSQIAPEYSITPVYNEEVLEQIHNITVPPLSFSNTLGTDGFWDIKQNPDTNYVQQNHTWEIVGSSSKVATDVLSWLLPKVLNSRYQVPSPADVMVMSRLSSKASVIYGDNALPTTSISLTYGTEVVCAVWIGTLIPPSASADTLTWWHVPGWLVLNPDDPQAGNNLGWLTLTNFDWHPLIPIVQDTGGAGFATKGYLGDLANYTFLDEHEIYNLHRTAVLSEWDIPTNA